MLRLLTLLSVLFVGCGATEIQSPDVRFESRDAVVDPRDQPLPGDASGEAPDAAPAVDVFVYDAADATTTAPDAGRADASSLDLPLFADTPTTLCTDLAERYAAAVREVSTCVAASECAARVCETLCCVCDVYVALRVDRLRVLDDLRGQALGLGCASMLRCPTTHCPAPRSGACSTDGRCVTLREAVDAGRDP